MPWHTVDHKARDDHDALVSRSFWLHDLPRPLLICRWRGHRPVIDGVGTPSQRGHVARWVVCDRCGTRPEPQGSLDRDLVIGQPYVAEEPHAPALQEPGPWPANPTGTLGGQLVIGGRHSVGAEIKIGNNGSEQPIAASLSLGPLGALYLHGERFGRGLQRRVNPTGWHSRVTGLSIHDGRAHWQIWAKRGEWSSTDPRWQQGSIPVDLRDILLGPARYTYNNHGDPIPATLRMPHGDDHPVTLQLQQQTLARRRGWRRSITWTVDCDIPGGVPTRPGDGGRITGLSVHVTATKADAWPAEALAGLALRLTQYRTRSGWQPTGDFAEATQA